MITSVKSSYGANVREDLMIVGYWRDFLIAADENGKFYGKTEPEHVLEIGTVCDAESELIPIQDLLGNDYNTFLAEF